MALVLTIILQCLVFNSCYTLQGHRGASENIRESKEKGVFVCEYKTIENPVIINDTLKIYVKEAWIEKQWQYAKKKGEIVSYDEYQIRINSKEEDLKGIDFDWTIGVESDLYLRASGKNSLIGDFKHMPNNMLVYPVQKGEAFIGNIPVIIGEFTLVKK